MKKRRIRRRRRRRRRRNGRRRRRRRIAPRFGLGDMHGIPNRHPLFSNNSTVFFRHICIELRITGVFLPVFFFQSSCGIVFHFIVSTSVFYAGSSISSSLEATGPLFFGWEIFCCCNFRVPFLVVLLGFRFSPPFLLRPLLVCRVPCGLHVYL